MVYPRTRSVTEKGVTSPRNDGTEDNGYLSMIRSLARSIYKKDLKRIC